MRERDIINSKLNKRKDMKTKFVLFTIATFIFNVTFSQTWSDESFTTKIATNQFLAKQVIPPSPEAAQLGQYGNVPVSLFTGTPQVSIPVYELKGNSLSLPVSLSYYSTGFKPQDIAGWTGLGWSLNAGGVITRAVMGNPDIQANYFNGSNNLVPPSSNDYFARFYYMQDLERGTREAQPDMYYFNFMGHSGKFLISTDQSIVKKQKDNLKITHCITCVPGQSFFSIVDENGITYEFREVEVTNMILDDIGGSSPITNRNFTYASSWYLSKVTSADGNETANFTYYTTAAAHKQFSNYLLSSSISYKHTSSNNLDHPAVNITSVSPTVTTFRKYLQNITLKKSNQNIAYLNFESATDLRQDLDHADYPGERLLQKIKIYSLENILKKEFDLTYGYFSNPNDNIFYRKRLQLQNVQEISLNTNAISKPPYVFEYNNSYIPSYQLSSMDHWGFYNGTDNIATLIPSFPSFALAVLYAGANRTPDFNSSVNTLLNKIKYPTGGYTTFEFELNNAHDQNNITTLADIGGVRIKNITDYSFDTKKSTLKNYQYFSNDNTTSGISTIPGYVTSSSYVRNGLLPLGNDRDSYGIITVNGIMGGLGTISGSHIGYSQVTEYQSDPVNNIPLGKTIYNYRLESFDTYNDYPSNGLLEKKAVYDNTNKLLAENTNTYSTSNFTYITGYHVLPHPNQDYRDLLCKYTNSGTTYYTWKNALTPTPICDATITNPVRLNLLPGVVNGQSVQLISQTEKKYDQLSNNYIITTKNLTYGNPLHTLPTQIDQTTNNNELLTTTLKYAADYSIPTGVTLDNAATGIKLLQTKNIIGAPVENIQLRQNSDGTNKRYLGGSITTYYPSVPYPQNIYRMEAAAPPSTLQLSSVSGTGIFTFDPLYKILGSFNYDAYGNIASQAKSNDLSKAYVWDYAASLPVAEVVNADAASVAFTSFENFGTGGNWQITGLIANTITGGISGNSSFNVTSTSPISKGGLSVSRQYIISYWSKSGAVAVSTNIGAASAVSGLNYNGWFYYEHILPVNSTSVTLSAATPINIDELRLYPKGALMTTTTYNPLVGVVAQCSINNQFLYYEYDGLNRLLNVKDRDGNIVQNYKYNYGLGTPLTPSTQSLFYNNQKQGNYTKSGCPAGTEPTTENYVVQYGKYVSSISQPDADNKATSDVTANGQAYAQNIGKCLYWNTQQSAFFSKNNCLPADGGSKCGPNIRDVQIAYIVPAHTYSSEVNLTAANQLALNDIAANGQNYANFYCTCSCTGVGYTSINGICEFGTRYNSSTVQQANGTWKCNFYYVFSNGSVIEYSEINSTPCPIQ
jgi:hypothetical protein